MITAQTVLTHLADSCVDALIRFLSENFADFAQDHQRYIQAADLLRRELDSSISPSVSDMMDSIRQQTASDLLFSGLLGLKANWEHFRDPGAASFLNMDFEEYLQENTAHRLPTYEKAQEVRVRFYRLLSPRQRVVYQDITAYISYLETAGPKLAHYFGFLLGNTLLTQVVPDYCPDADLTQQYRRMLESYFGQRID